MEFCKGFDHCSIVIFPGSSQVFWNFLQFFSRFPEMDIGDVLDLLFQDPVKNDKKNLGPWTRFICSRIPVMEF